MKYFLLALVFSALSMFGADATGKWSGSFVITSNGETHDDVAYLDLKQDGNKITGTAGPNVDKQFPIRTGTIEGAQLKLEVEQKPGAIIYLTLTLAEDRLTGDAKAENDGNSMSGKMDLKREK